MAKPAITPYATGYPCKTGASLEIGGYARVTLYANHQCGQRRLVGRSAGTVDGIVWAIVPVVTWVEITSGMYWYDDGTSNVPDDSNWRNWNAGGGTSRHNVKLCWKMIVDEPAVDAKGQKHTIVLVDALTGTLNGGTGYYELPATFNQVTGVFDMAAKYAMEQRVELTETDNRDGEWLNLPEEFRHEGMGCIHAEFTRVWDDALVGTVTINGGTPYNIQPWTATAGAAWVDLAEVDPILWYPTQDAGIGFGGIIQSYWPGSGSNNYPLVQVGEAVVGSSAMDYYLPDDGDFETDKRFRLWDRWNASYAEADDGAYRCELIGEGNTFEAWACGLGNGSKVYGLLEWTQAPYAYQFVGEMKYLDGGLTPPGTPTFQNISSPYTGETLTWNGLTSPVYRGGGLWKISGTSERTGGRFLADPDWATYAAEAADGDGIPDDPHAHIEYVGGSCWFEQTTVPAAWDPPWFSMKWLNPEDFGGYADGGRVLLRYPRSKEVLRIGISDSLTVDSFALADWQGYNCTVEAEGGGGIRVTDVETGAYVWRTYLNKAEGPPAVPGTYWPGHRYARLDCTCYEEGTATQTPFVGKLRFGGRNITDAGVSTTWTRTHSHRLRDEYFDVCRPDEQSLPNADLEQSWISQALPQQSWDRYGEKTLMSWSWGPGAINRIEVRELSPGIDYVFREIEACQLTLKLDDTSLSARARGMCQTAHEYAAKRLLGWTGPENTDDEVSLERILSYIVNGRTAFESGACHEEITYSGEVPSYGRNNYSIQSIDDGTNRWPADTFGGLAITDLIAWDNAWWDNTDFIYTDERVLFCPECTPAWFLEDGVQAEATSAPNTGLCTLSARPIYDWITPDIYYGDGGEETSRPGRHIFRFKILVGNRLHGMMWKDKETAEETEGDGTFDYSVSNPSSSEYSSQIGSYDTAVQLNPTDLVFETKTESAIPLTRPNYFVRCCLYIATVADIVGTRMRHGKYWLNQVLQPYRDVDING